MQLSQNDALSKPCAQQVFLKNQTSLPLVRSLLSKFQEQSLTQAKIDPLRQGQRLDAIDQKPKHDSSKTEVTLDAVMLEAERKRGNQKPKPKQKLPKQNFSL